MAALLSFFRGLRMSRSAETPARPEEVPQPRKGRQPAAKPKRPTPTPVLNGRSAAGVAKQRKTSASRGGRRGGPRRTTPAAQGVPALKASHVDDVVPSESIQVKIKVEEDEEGEAVGGPDGMDVDSDSSSDGGGEDADDSGLYTPGLSATFFPYPGHPQRKPRERAVAFQGSVLDADADADADADVSATGPTRSMSDGEDSDFASDLTDEDDDAVEENWDWLFEAEPPPPPPPTTTTTPPPPPKARSKAKAKPPPKPEEADDWPVDEEERQAYEQGVAAIDGYAAWTADEKRLHRLLALRGFHPLLPATWRSDFLGVPLYPSLFAPDGPDGGRRPTVITNYGSQFRATKALRALFDLQARVSGLRQTGGHDHGHGRQTSARIGALVERELRRYIAWAAADAGLDRCGPLAAMPNIAAKQFVTTTTAAGGGGGGSSNSSKARQTNAKHGLARQVQDYFGDWVARYRAYYASLPAYEVERREEGEAAPAAPAAPTAPTASKRLLRPPRLLYGFVIVQHAVMLLVVDAAASRSSRHPRPRCLANFNLSLGDRWLDASLSVAIPVHVARAAMLRCRAGLVLPTTRVDDVDEDA